MKSEEELIWESYILKESPWYIPPIDKEEDDYISQIPIKDIKSKTKLIGKYKNINIYFNESKQQNEYYFISNKEFIAYYRFSKNKVGIRTNMIWNSSLHKGIFKDVFLNFILPKYKIIYSDDQMNDFGFNFWVKLSSETNPNYSIYIYNPHNNSELPLQNPKDILKYKEKLSTDWKYTQFIIKYDG